MEANVTPRTEAKRTVIALPDVDKFYDILQDRINYALGRYGALRETFTVFINALPRKEQTIINRFEQVPLIYGGVRQQRLMLEGETPNKKTTKDWEALERMSILSEAGVVSSELFQLFRNGTYGLDNIIESGGTLYDYFQLDQPQKKREAAYNPGQLNEYNILRHNIDLLSYRYISIPLIQFGEFDGVIHILYSDKDYKRIMMDNPERSGASFRNMIASFIKSFSSLYEGIILDWELVGSNADKETAVRAALDVAIDPVFFETFNKNPILRELSFQEHYKRHERYYQMRFEQTDTIQIQRRQQYRKIAIMSILIDSYAHNVTAHSLTALEWWFRLRAERIRREGQESYDRFVEDYAYLPVVAKDTLALELYPLMKFLLDKGAFWTGLTRERSFGGKTSSLFSILWFDFINNPLYLGTIAFSEGILKLNINITLLKEIKNIDKAYFEKQVLVDENGVELDGNFVSVDLSKLSAPTPSDRPGRMSDFVVPSEKFEAFEEKLKEYRAFFPGGVVGRHAFFTIIENEIRNVKHYPKEAIQEMQKNGLTINISIQEDTYRKGDSIIPGKFEYFKIGIWINQPIGLNQTLVENRITKLGEDIIDNESFKPKLGGTYQDKVCAAMLFNNTFTSVQSQDGPRNKRFYPWMKSGGAFVAEQDGLKRYDYEITWPRFTEEDYSETKHYFDQHFKSGLGYFKKFFYIWKGEDVYNLVKEDSFSSKYENYSRFKFVCVPSGNQKQFNEVRQEGVIRVIPKAVKSLTAAYRIWLKIWLSRKYQKPNYRIKFTVNNQPVGHLYWNGKTVEYSNRGALKKLSQSERDILLDSEQTKTFNIKLRHGNQERKGPEATPGICRYRNHGIFKQYFLNGAELTNCKMSESKALELLEVISTRISIFDNRIANRVEKTVGKYNLEHALDCRFYKEDIDIWEQAKSECIVKCHILVVHLSFVESFRDKQGNKIYSENNINDFIKNEVVKNRPNQLNDFLLVFTTGRGRTQWWRSIEKENTNYTAFTTFRPVESIIDCVENAINMEDDFELKYRLVKVLFGS